jgi:hypothetical protein
MMKTLSLHMQANNGVSTNMGIVYVATVQNKAGIHFMVNLSDHEVQCDGYYDGTITDAYQRISKTEYCH